ncbi:MAG: hypothetical protein M5U12_00210 [Verrucomicrobia bacterium]|nr:hypothetical protein [Verrucomicrobiota bacterium]
MQQAVRIQAQQVPPVPLHRVEERTLEQPHLREVEWLRDQGHNGRDRSVPLRCRACVLPQGLGCEQGPSHAHPQHQAHRPALQPANSLDGVACAHGRHDGSKGAAGYPHSPNRHGAAL